MTGFYIWPKLWPKYPPFFLIFVTLKGCIFVIGKLVWLHCSDTIVKPTWQRIMIFQKKNCDMIFLPYRPPLIWCLLFRPDFAKVWFLQFFITSIAQKSLSGTDVNEVLLSKTKKKLCTTCKIKTFLPLKHRQANLSTVILNIDNLRSALPVKLVDQNSMFIFLF